MSVMEVWAILPSFPLDFWSREALESIGNWLGSFIKLEPNWVTKKDRRWAWILDSRRKRQIGWQNRHCLCRENMAPKNRLLTFSL
jgi:hypothetical protein